MRTILINNKTFFVAESIDNHNKHWDYVNNGKWEPHTYKIFDTFIDNEHSYIDFGAWIGSTILYGSQTAKHTYAVEPDIVALKTLKKNIILNSILRNKITLYEGCISDLNGQVKLGVKGKFNFGESGSSILYGFGKEVNAITFDTFIEKYNIIDCNFIKIDIEGAEIIVLPTMKKYLKRNKPVLYVSFHPLHFNTENKEIMMDTLSIYNKYYNAQTFNEIQFKEIFNFREVIIK